MKLKITILLILILVGSVLYLNNNQVSAEFDYSLGIQGFNSSVIYISWELEEFNDIIEDNNDLIRNYVGDTREALFEDNDIEYKVTKHIKEDDTADKMESGLGYNFGINLSPISHRLLDFEIFPGLQYETNFSNRRAEAEFESSGKITEYNDTELEEKIRFELDGFTETEFEVDISGIALPVKIPVFETIDLSVTPLYFWGDGEIIHENNVKFSYSDDPSDEDLENILKDAEGENYLETSEIFDISSTLGWKFGVIYDYDLTENLSIFTKGNIRRLEMDIDVYKEDYEDNDTEDLFNLLDSSIYGELEDVTEDFGGTEISAGISLLF